MTSNNPGKVFLIINNKAGHGKGQQAAELAVSLLCKKGCTVEHAFTQYPGHATQLASQASARDYDMVVAVGGDGTANETAQGLIGTTTTFGIIPIGSGNGLAREVGISTNVHKACQTIWQGVTRKIDVCRINNQRFFCTSGIGFDAHIAYEMSIASSRGFWRYVRLSVMESLFYKPMKVKINIDGKSMDYSAFLITFANASQYGNNIYIAPAASMSDGLIDVVIVKPFWKILLPVFGLSLFFKVVHRLPFVDCYKAKEIELTTANTSDFHFDGELGKIQLPEKIFIDPDKLF
ncbi:MAG: diacylglycerol/lipid kinase family protein, partial [Candidatus Saccharibacteria bacterium]